MSDNLKYDALLIHATNNARSRDIDNILSMKIETELGKQLVSLIKNLLESEDDGEIDRLKMMIDNLQDDIKDSKKGRNERLKMSREMPREQNALDITEVLGVKNPADPPPPFAHIDIDT